MSMTRHPSPIASTLAQTARRFAPHLMLALVVACVPVQTATAAPDAKPPASGAPAVAPVPTENPLRSADDATRKRAIDDAYLTFQRSCRPCHGNLGAGDGPYAVVFPQRAADLRRPSRDISTDAVRFKRIRDGAAALPERNWESNMPAFGGELDPQQIWGLVLLLEDLGKWPGGVDPDVMPKDVYDSRCAACHGTAGNGDGPLAPEVFPAPRDLAHGPYRLRATVSGGAPLDSDIIGVTAHGLGDTSMGRFLALGAQRLEDLAGYVQSLAPTLFATQAATIATTPMPSESIVSLATRGRAVYETAKCAECHGPGGRGDGPAAATLKDSAGHPSIATNLTKRWLFKGGGTAADVYRILTAGMDGTPMQAYPTMSPEDRWAVGYYIDRLARSRMRFAPTVQAAVVTEKLPLDPSAPFWKAALPALVPLGAQMEVPPYWSQPSVDQVEVVAAVNDDQFGILLIWDDRSRNVTNEDAAPTDVPATLARRGSWRLTDAVAVQFPEKADPKGVLPLAYLGDPKHPVQRWTWSADRQERGEAQALIEQIAGANAAPTTVGDAPPVQTAATYADGQWRVLLIGKRPAQSLASLPMAVQAWDGAFGEAGRWQSFSAWLDVKLR
jgi:DMSO reductase family type II enzyme heme b subunit